MKGNEAMPSWLSAAKIGPPAPSPPTPWALLGACGHPLGTMQGLLTKASAGLSKASLTTAASAASRAGTTAAFRPPTGQKAHGKAGSGLSHTARSFQAAAAATEAPPAPPAVSLPTL